MTSDRERYERWIRKTPAGGRDGIPAATVILLREAGTAFECLMLRRNSKLAFVGGNWVFPGGRVDEADREGCAGDELCAARRAAVRESHEEAGLVLDERAMVTFSHWTPPSMTPKRFLTWFFIARAPQGVVTIDDDEIKAHQWIAPAEAMARRNRGEIELAPPTWISLERLARSDSASAAIEQAAGAAPEIFETRISMTDNGPVALYDGDSGYEAGDASLAGDHHRLEMREDGWRYRRDDWG
jgi:8-oxo-dGTP pyrophosphatase MutT (NUDIX family)